MDNTSLLRTKLSVSSVFYLSIYREEGIIKWEIVLFGNSSLSILAIIELSFMFVSILIHAWFIHTNMLCLELPLRLVSSKSSNK